MFGVAKGVNKMARARGHWEVGGFKTHRTVGSPRKKGKAYDRETEQERKVIIERKRKDTEREKWGTTKVRGSKKKRVGKKRCTVSRRSKKQKQGERKGKAGKSERIKPYDHSQKET